MTEKHFVISYREIDTGVEIEATICFKDDFAWSDSMITKVKEYLARFYDIAAVHVKTIEPTDTKINQSTNPNQNEKN